MAETRQVFLEEFCRCDLSSDCKNVCKCTLSTYSTCESSFDQFIFGTYLFFNILLTVINNISNT